MKPQKQTTDEKKKNKHNLFSRVEPCGRATAPHTNTPVTTVSPALTNPMAPGSGLQVVLRVEVAVDENDGVGCGEVQADSSCKRPHLLFFVRACDAAACFTSTCCRALLVEQLHNHARAKKVAIWARKLGFCLFVLANSTEGDRQRLPVAALIFPQLL